MPDLPHSSYAEEFSASWDRVSVVVQENLPSHGWTWILPINELIQTLRRCGDDTQFRAGQSMWTLILSRSAQRGLEIGSPQVIFDLRPSGQMVVTYRDGLEPPIPLDHLADEPTALGRSCPPATVRAQRADRAGFVV